MLICLECGHVFEEDDILTWKEGRGEYWGAPCYEEIGGCPLCQGDYVEAKKCDYCGEFIISDYIKTEDGNRYCKNCYKKMKIGDES